MTEEQLIQQFQLIEDTLNEAWETNDVGRVAQYLSADWVLIEPQYGIVEKDRFLSLIKQGSLSHLSMKKKVWRVKCYNDIAVVTARGMNTGVHKSEPFNSEQWVTNIYRNINENWI